MSDSVEYNLYTRFHFKNQPGVSQMKATGGAFAGLYKNAKMAQAGVRQIETGMRQLGMVGMGAVAVLGGIVKRGMEFGKAWKDAQAVLRGVPKNIEALQWRAKQLGATTLFTAAQAAKGMEELARAGLTAKQVSLAIRPVLKLSVADNVELAQSAKIVASSMNMFRKEIKNVSEVTDTFAYVSRNSMTNTTELGEAFKYAGPAAKIAGQSFYETMGTLGLLAQAGIRGSLAGTALKNALVKLSKGGETANKIFGGKKAFINAVTDKNTGRWKSLTEILTLTMKKLANVKNDAERAALAFKLFGIRGITTFAAFKEAGVEDFANLMTNIKRDSKGTAEEMARIKRESMHAQWLLFKSALDGVALSLYDIIKPTVISAVKMFSGTLSDLAAAFKDMSEGMAERKVAAKWGKTIAGVAFGIKEAFVEVGKTLKSVGKSIFGIFVKISGGGKDSAKKITKLIAKSVLFAAALAPVIAGVGALGLAFGGMFNVVVGGFKVLSALTSKWGLAFLAVTYIFAGGQKKGESFFVTMTRGLKNLISLANKLLYPFKVLAKHLGTIPALMAGIMTYKVGKGLLARAGGALAMSKNPLARMLGGVTGAATGMPVFVTNWPAGGLGGIGGGLGAPGVAGAAAGRMGLMARMGATARYAGMTLPGMAFGGKFVGAGAMGAGTAMGKTAALVSGIGTATVAIGAFAAALAPAVGGLYKLSQAYDPAYQAELKKKLMAEQKRREETAITWDKLMGRREMATGKLKGFRTLEELKAETWEQKRAREARRELGVTEVGAAGLRTAYEKALAGDVWAARGGVAAFGTEKIAKLYQTATEYDLKQVGLSKEMITLLKAISTSSSMTIDHLAKGYTAKIYIDGREIAVATATHRNESRERAGRIPAAGARRRALTRGTD